MTPYYEREGVTIYNGDCLEVMPSLEPQSVDCIIADMPYGTTECAWDAIIPLAPMWEQVKRVIKPLGAIVLFASQPFTTVLIASNMEQFKYTWVWKKSLGANFMNAKNRPIPIHEDICVFSPGTVANRSPRRMTYNPQGLIHRPHHKKRLAPATAKAGGFIRQRPSHVAAYDVEYINYPKSVIQFANPNHDNVHRTQKPLPLLEYLVLTYSNPGDLVLDFTMGSGTTLEAAKILGRRAIGIDIDPAWCDEAANRLIQDVLPLAV